MTLNRQGKRLTVQKGEIALDVATKGILHHVGDSAHVGNPGGRHAYSRAGEEQIKRAV